MSRHTSNSFTSMPPIDANDKEVAHILCSLANSSNPPQPPSMQDPPSSMTRNETHAYPTESTATSQGLPDGYHDWALWLSTVFGPPTPLPAPNFPIPTNDRGKALYRHRPYVTFNSALQQRQRQHLQQMEYLESSAFPTRSIISPGPSTLAGSSISPRVARGSNWSAAMSKDDPHDELYFDAADKSHCNTTQAAIDTHPHQEGIDDSDTCSYYTAFGESTSHHEQQPRAEKRPSIPTTDPVKRPRQQQCHICHQTQVPQSTLDSLKITEEYIANLATTKHKRLNGSTGRGKAWDPATFIECPDCKLAFHCGCPLPPVKNYPSRYKEWHCADCTEKFDEQRKLQSIPTVLHFDRRNKPIPDTWSDLL